MLTKIRNEDDFLVNVEILEAIAACESAMSTSYFMSRKRTTLKKDNFKHLHSLVKERLFHPPELFLSELINIVKTQRGIYKSETKSGKALLLYIQNSSELKQHFQSELNVNGPIYYRHLDMYFNKNKIEYHSNFNSIKNTKHNYKAYFDIRNVEGLFEFWYESALTVNKQWSRSEPVPHNSNFGWGQDLYLNQVWDARYLFKEEFEGIKDAQVQGYFHDLRSIVWSSSSRLSHMAVALMFRVISYLDEANRDQYMYIYNDLKSLASDIRSQPAMKKYIVDRATQSNLIKSSEADNLFIKNSSI
ncbi:hypothetical protein [Vibrio tetraodonis]|uniref:hypothetical protein n=1 Tax=Vibrio tetraodonis TaxID=2231647 RepID=UPI0013B3FA19|nr:hypothetical protein [Vibrio tetraodonis]